MKFRAKIWMLPACAAGVFIVGMAISYVVGARTSSALTQLRAVDYPFQESIAKVDRNVEQFRLKLQSAASEGDESALADVEAIAKNTQAAIDELGKLDGKQEAAQAFTQTFDAYQGSALAATKSMLGKGEAGDSMAKMQASMASLEKLLAEGKETAAVAVASAQDSAARGVDTSLWVGVGTSVVVLLVLGVASTLVVRSVWRDLGDEPTALREWMQRIAEGDLSTRQDLNSSGSGDSLRAAVVQMSDKLRGTVGAIRHSTDSIATASSEIAAGNQDLSSRTEHTAANLQKTAASMEQLTGTVRQSAESARQANALSNSAASAAQRGGSIVSQVVTNMEEINASSRKIGEIIGVIDGIAFQTNILALNAAVEAARAGEQGRGFAVVASEVRSLAQRSAEAAKEIKTLIHASSEKVESGARLVQDAGSAMNDIVSGVERVTAIITEISAATSEQSSGISDVNTAVNELDQMTQQNSALVEESAAAAESLREQAQRLTEAVSIFRLDNNESAAPATATARPVAPTPATKVPVRRAAATTSTVKADVASIAKPAAVTAGADDWETF